MAPVLPLLIIMQMYHREHDDSRLGKRLSSGKSLNYLHAKYGRIVMDALRFLMEDRAHEGGYGTDKLDNEALFSACFGAALAGDRPGAGLASWSHHTSHRGIAIFNS